MARLNNIKLRRDTAANWTSVNPTLDAGEPGYETDTKRIKIGDGSTAWTSLRAPTTMVEIARQTLGSSQQVIDTNDVIAAASMPQVFDKLLMCFALRSDRAAAAALVHARLNNDSSSVYSAQNVEPAGSTVSTAQTQTGGTAAHICRAPGNTAPANSWSMGWLEIPFYTSTVFDKSILSFSTQREDTSGTGMVEDWNNMAWFPASPVAVTRIQLASQGFGDTSKFVAQSRWILYGI